MQQIRKGKRRKRKRYLPVVVTVVLLLVVACVGALLVTGQTATGSSDGDYLHILEALRGSSSSSGTEVEISDQTTGYAVSSCDSYATETGISILEQGGNAVDAAIAMSYTLAVSQGCASGLGGGGCMIVYDPETEIFYFYDYGAEAGNSGGSTRVLVPGFVNGMATLFEDWGTLDMEILMADAIDLCDGVIVNSTLANRIDAASGSLSKNTAFYANGAYLTVGDTLVQEELKETLQILLNEGWEAFYTGSIAEDIVANYGITMSDLAAYETIVSEAVVGSYMGYTIAAAAAPFSGATLIQMLEMAEILDIDNPEDNNKSFVSSLVQITAAAFTDRISSIYDYRFTSAEEDQSENVSENYIRQLLSLELTDFEDEDEGEDTTSFVVIDSNGMIVACTNTLSSFFGCKSEVDGFFMNNTGRNFGTGVNAYAAGKRPRSHIAPTILVSEDSVMAIATPGGDVIVKVMANVLMDICQFGTDAQEAIDKQRVYVSSGSKLTYEIGYSTSLFVDVSGCGYTALAKQSHYQFGNITLVGWTKSGGYYATEDIRREGAGAAKNE